ncbi:MAG: hypothetical protein REI11_04925, partial [Patulibacter sp.]|nr:hypothetical protein [Patulibacter sp.]
MALTFEPLAYGDRITVINPVGDVGVITLWSPQRSVLKKLAAVAPSAVDPATSRIAAVANLYGDGLFAMLRNLLFNPQLRHLIVVGQDLGLGVPDELEALLRDGVEATTVFGQPLLRVRGTARLLPVVDGFDAGVLQQRFTMTRLGKVGALDAGVEELLAGLPSHDPPTEQDRLRIDAPADETAGRTFRPSDPQAHSVTRRRPLDCWEELVVRTTRFGQSTQLRKGARLELLNVKVVIDDPVEEPARVLAEFGFNLERFRAYQRAILDPALPEGISYTYGNRLRGHFAPADAEPGAGREPFDTLTAAAQRLARDPESRGAYVSLWDTPLDLDPDRSGPPCLTTLFFRLHDGRYVESVLIPANKGFMGEQSDRLTLCVSSQVGCAYDCKFC